MDSIDRIAAAQEYVRDAIVNVAAAYGQAVMGGHKPENYTFGNLVDELREWLTDLEASELVAGVAETDTEVPE